MDLLELASAFRTGELSAAGYIFQIESAFKKRESSVLAFVPEANRFERLHKEAEALISRFPNSKNRPPLFGTLVGVKDIFHVEGITTRAGSRIPAQELQGDEAECITKLKNEGMLILGKTVTTEFAYFTPGPTRNPHNPDHTPGGSSSGSAAAVGAGLCLLAIGTQTIGSLIRPAAYCGTVAFKPTYDRISRIGVIPLSPSLDHVGFFTQDVSTAQRVASSLYKDWKASVSLTRKPILGVPEGPYLASASDFALARFNAICALLAEAGYELRRIRVMDDYERVRARHEVIIAADAARVHKKWFEKYERLYSARLSELIRRGQSITDSQLQEALRARKLFRAEMTRTMNENNVDLWISPPTIGPAPRGLASTGEPAMNLPWTQIGFPAVNLPAGKSSAGLPMGLQVVGKWNMDEELLAWVADIEKVVSRL